MIARPMEVVIDRGFSRLGIGARFLDISEITPLIKFLVLSGICWRVKQCISQKRGELLLLGNKARLHRVQYP